MSSRELQREVFLACRTVFAGKNAQLRKPKKIGDVLEQHKRNILPLTEKHGWDIVADIVRQLLEKEVFGSTLRAKIEFPELYETTPDRGAQRSASENEAARSEAEALAEAEPTQAEFIEEPAVREKRPRDEEDTSSASNPRDGRSPTLFPAYLPYKCQHRILTLTQSRLEQVCFEFGKKWLPEVLEAKKWDCPEAVELTKWTKTLAKHRKEISPNAINASHGPLTDSTIFATDRLRHAAVHRLPTTAAGIKQMVLSAAKLAEALQDAVQAAKIQQVHCELESFVRDMEGNKEFLESRLDQELKAIDEERAELDRREQRAVRAMVDDDGQYQVSVSLGLERTIADLLNGTEGVPWAAPDGSHQQVPKETLSCGEENVPNGVGTEDEEEGSGSLY